MSNMAVADGTEFPLLAEEDLSPARRFLVVTERGQQGWGAYVPDLPGVVAAAETEAEVRSLILEAVEFHLDGLRAEGEPIPHAVSRPLWVTI